LEAKKRYVTGFNGLRTLGVLAVILYHLYPQNIQGGFLGVVLFFVLSGYLVTDSLLREYSSTKKIRPLKFWGKRAKTYLPHALGCVLDCLALFVFLSTKSDEGTQVKLPLKYFHGAKLVANSAGLILLADAAGESPFKHIYYLAIEGQFFIFGHSL
jgi:Predicted acyltransferases